MIRHGARFQCWGAALCATALAGCATRPVAVDPGGCPPVLHQALSISTAIAAIQLPPSLYARSGAVPLIAGTGRRILLSVHVARSAPQVRLLANSVDLLTYGGTLAGWARVVRPRAAEDAQSLAVDGGWLEIAPFVPGPRLHSRAEAIDVLLLPGGHPRAALAVRPGRLWTGDGQPRPAHDVRLHFFTVSHMTRLHAVDATATFQFKAQHLTGAHEHWTCSISRNLQLITRREALPALWVLRHRSAGHAPPPMLAVFNRHRGAFPLVFLDPQTARGFARWIREQHAQRSGRYVLGLLGATDHRFVPLGAMNGPLHAQQWGGH